MRIFGDAFYDRPYVTGGEIQRGSFASAEPSEEELVRRKMLADGVW
jgi:hypothetical protein